MLKVRRIFFEGIFIALVASSVFAQQDNEAGSGDVKIPPGMERRPGGSGVSIIVPKGGRLNPANPNLSIIETADEYAARKFVDVEKRLDALEDEISSLKSALQEVKNELRAGKNAQQ